MVWDDYFIRRMMRDMMEMMEDMERAFGRERLGWERMEGHQPWVDVVDKGKEVVVAVEIPGVRKEDIDIELDGRNLYISVERKERKESEGEFVSRYLGFRRVITLPAEVDEKKVKAEYRNGLLKVVLPKKKGEGRKIKIE